MCCRPKSFTWQKSTDVSKKSFSESTEILNEVFKLRNPPRVAFGFIQGIKNKNTNRKFRLRRHERHVQNMEIWNDEQEHRKLSSVATLIGKGSESTS